MSLTIPGVVRMRISHSRKNRRRSEHVDSLCSRQGRGLARLTRRKCFLAMAGHQRGEHEEALQWYQRAVENKAVEIGTNFEGHNHPELLNFRHEAQTLLRIESSPQSS